jgi:hypothetical protein
VNGFDKNSSLRRSSRIMQASAVKLLLTYTQRHRNFPDRKEVRMTTTIATYSKLVAGLVLLLACAIALQAAVPGGWLLAGTKPASYDVGTDAQAAYNGHPSAYLKAKVSDTGGFGTLMQSFRAGEYVGKRIRFSAYVKSDGIQNWAGLWMRVDSGPQQMVLDNMQDRPIKGTTGWQKYEVVLDVPQDATGIALGVLLDGPGEVRLNGGKFEVVGTDLPTTDKKLRDEPTNFDFEN